MSSMCKNQLVAALTSFGILITLWVIGSLAARGGPIAKFLSYLSLPEHYRDFSPRYHPSERCYFLHQFHMCVLICDVQVH